MTAARPPRVRVIGATDDAEFRPLAERLATLPDVRFATGRETTRPLEPPGEAPPNEAGPSGAAPRPTGVEWLVFFSPRPESVPRSLVDRWQRWYPLARPVVILGSWCEGETRTGRPWPGVIRRYWHEAGERFFAALADERAAGDEWRLPRTASDVERWLAERPSNSPAASQVVAVRASAREAWESIADAVRACGREPVRWPDEEATPPAAAVAVLVDLPESLDAATDELPASSSDEARPSRRLPTLALIGFPRAEDREALAARGVDLLSKPWRLSELVAWLDARIAATEGGNASRPAPSSRSA